MSDTLFYRSSKYLLLFVSVFIFSAYCHGNTVKNIKAHYSHGQVFITWVNCPTTNLQYNIYRSKIKFTNINQLNSSTYLGFVRDSSSKNYRLSILDSTNIYYKWRRQGNHLPPHKGLYAVTCTEEGTYYYAVMVKDLATNTETTSILTEENTLVLPVSEKVAKPQPVLQDSIKMSSGRWKYRFTQFCNNQETPLYPAMNSTGSYGFNFYLVKQGFYQHPPLRISYKGEDLAASVDVSVAAEYDDCWILGVDDWLPVQFEDGKFGTDAFYCCYHEDFNIYTDQNPLPSNGVIKTYPQKRIIETLHWLRTAFNIDSASIYARGSSHNGIGGLLTAVIYPEQIAAVYGIVEPITLSATQPIYEQMWGLEGSGLKSDVTNWKTGEILSFDQFVDLKTMLHVNAGRSVPLIFDIHGKNDHTVGWNETKVAWLDSLNNNHYGGTWYWDQREHGGYGKNFTSDETMPAFLRYHTNKSYPAFSNCSVNHDPGTGKKTNGDPYGAYNGYIDFNDSISDEKCDYELMVFIRDFYVGGDLDPEQYFTCTTDIAFRRLQNFNPVIGDIIEWENSNENSEVIQLGSFTFENELIVLKEMIVNKAGNRIHLNIKNCSRTSHSSAYNSNVEFIKTTDGYHASIYSEGEKMVSLSLFDITGRKAYSQNFTLAPGYNTLLIPTAEAGIYIAEIAGLDNPVAEKLIF